MMIYHIAVRSCFQAPPPPPLPSSATYVCSSADDDDGWLGASIARIAAASPLSIIIVVYLAVLLPVQEVETSWFMLSNGA
jgi:hypothetical protein